MITEEDIQKQIKEDQKIIDKIHDDLKAAKRYNRIASNVPLDCITLHSHFKPSIKVTRIEMTDNAVAMCACLFASSASFRASSRACC